MAFASDAPPDRLWKKHRLGFQDFDDLTLGRWRAQTFGRWEGKAWRLSHSIFAQ